MFLTTIIISDILYKDTENNTPKLSFGVLSGFVWQEVLLPAVIVVDRCFDSFLCKNRTMHLVVGKSV